METTFKSPKSPFRSLAIVMVVILVLLLLTAVIILAILLADKNSNDDSGAGPKTGESLQKDTIHLLQEIEESTNYVRKRRSVGRLRAMRALRPSSQLRQLRAGRCMVINYYDLRQRPHDQSTCQSPDCIRTANRLLSAMKTDVNPCDNFYEFACGQWVETHRVPEDKGSIDAMEETSVRLEQDLQDLLERPAINDIAPIRKAKTFYRTCLDEASITKSGTGVMLNFISDLGGWPVLNRTWNPSSFSLEESVALARQYTTNYVWPIPHGILLGINILTDFKVPGKHVIYLDQPSLLMDGRDMYIENATEILGAYLQYTSEVARALGATAEDAAIQMEQMVNFERDIAKISVAVSDRRDMETNYRRHTLNDLYIMYPQLNWLLMLQTTFRDAGVTIDRNEPIVLWMKPYYDELFPLLARTPARTIANYIIWRLIAPQLTALNENFRVMKLNFEKLTEGIKQLKPRSLYCAESTNKYMDQATGRLYAEKVFGPRERDHMMEMISYLRRIFRDIVNNAEWMDNSTKQAALIKLEAMKSFIGFPSFIFNDTILAEYYQKVDMSPSNYFNNLRVIRRYVGIKQLEYLRQPTFNQWPERPAIVNAFYHLGLNAIVFPAGILQSPYYDINYPASVNFGGIGLVIGHEITHGYDASGRAFDAQGLLHNWWSNFSMSNFVQRADCVVNHYSQFEVPGINMNINGNMTLSENIADIGGIKQSHRAYKLWLQEHNNQDIRLPGMSDYTNEQLFFINTAQLWCSKFTVEAAKKSVLASVHSLPKFRVLGELRNSQEFTEAFQCPVGSYMNPDQPKCSLW